MDLKKIERRRNAYLRSRSLLLCSAAKAALAEVALGCECGPRYVGSHGGWCSDLIEK